MACFVLSDETELYSLRELLAQIGCTGIHDPDPDTELVECRWVTLWCRARIRVMDGHRVVQLVFSQRSFHGFSESIASQHPVVQSFIEACDQLPLAVAVISLRP
jgi:hypothetical protein